MDGVLLRRDSHTARLLFANTPTSLYLESRLLLVGQIPPDWLRKSQKRWKRWSNSTVRAANRGLGSTVNKVDTDMVAAFTKFRHGKLQRSGSRSHPARIRHRRMTFNEGFGTMSPTRGAPETSWRDIDIDHNIHDSDASVETIQNERDSFDDTVLINGSSNTVQDNTGPDSLQEPSNIESSRNSGEAPPLRTTQSFAGRSAGSRDDTSFMTARSRSSRRSASLRMAKRPHRSLTFSASPIKLTQREPSSSSEIFATADLAPVKSPGASSRMSRMHNRIFSRSSLRPIEESPSSDTSDSEYYSQDSDYTHDGNDDNESTLSLEPVLSSDKEVDFGNQDGYNCDIAAIHRHFPAASSGEERCTAPRFSRRHRLKMHLRPKSSDGQDRQKTPRDARFFHKRRGEILFSKDFLVQIRETRKLVHPGSEVTEYSHPETACTDRWREYTVVARYTGKVSAPVTIYFYHTPNVADLSRKMTHRWSRSLKHKIHLDGTYRSGLFSSLDLTVALWSHSKRRQSSGRSLVYIFASQSNLAQMSWLYFLNNSISNGKSVPSSLKVSVPELQLEVDLPASRVFKTSLRVTAEAAERAKSGKEDTKMEYVSYGDLRKPISQGSALGGDVVELLWNIIHEVIHADAKHEAEMQHKKLGLAWRRFDRLKWVTSTQDIHLLTSLAMLDTHELEFREKMASTRPQLVAGVLTHEPVPLEGFCWRLTTWKGAGRKQSLATRTYLHTHDHLLFYSSPQNTTLPLLTHEGRVIETADPEELRKLYGTLPSSHRIEPYALDSKGHIQWLKQCRHTGDADVMDAYAVFESDRRTNLIASADGVIDMTTIESVRPISKEDYFEIGFTKNQNVLIRVSSKAARDIWVEKLNDLVAYWKERRHADNERTQYLYRENGKIFDMTVDMTSLAVAKSESESAFVDPLTFTPLAVTASRSIIMSGHIFEKRSRHDTFRHYYAVLTAEKFVLYHVQYRTSQKGRLPHQVYFSTHLVYDLKQTYVFSGVLAEDHLLDDDKYFDQNNPGVRALPRAYPDGWTSSDSETDRAFVLWTTGRRMFLAGARTGRKVRKQSRKLICLARSRYERDIWVNCLQDVLTKLTESRSSSYDV